MDGEERERGCFTLNDSHVVPEIYKNFKQLSRLHICGISFAEKILFTDEDAI
jgi:hypothetical protein